MTLPLPHYTHENARARLAWWRAYHAARDPHRGHDVDNLHRAAYRCRIEHCWDDWMSVGGSLRFRIGYRAERIEHFRSLFGEGAAQ